MSTQTDKIREAADHIIRAAKDLPDTWGPGAIIANAERILSELEAQPSQTDEQLYKQAIDDVTPEALERIDKRLAAIDAQTDDLEAKAREWLRTEQNTADTDDLRTNGKEVAFMLAAFARWLARPKDPAPTVDDLMEFLEDYIEEGIEQTHDHSSDHGWQYDRGHPNWDKTMNDLRARLTKLLTNP